MSITVFLADDHAIVRDGLKLLLEVQPNIKVVGEAANGRDAVCQVERLQPDVAIVDIAMPELNGIEATREIRKACPATRVIILSMYSTTEHIFRAFQAGACGYLLKESAGIEVMEAVRRVQDNRLYLGKKILDESIIDNLGQFKEVKAKSPLARLSLREREVLQFAVEGKSSAEIANILFLSPKTVETYRSRIMKKLGLSNFPSLIKFAIQHGLTPP